MLAIGICAGCLSLSAIGAAYLGKQLVSPLINKRINKNSAANDKYTKIEKNIITEQNNKKTKIIQKTKTLKIWHYVLILWVPFSICGMTFLVPLMRGRFEDVEITQPEIISKPPSGYEMIQKIEKSQKYSKKIKTLSIIGKLLFDQGYEAAFIAGMLANIFHEGEIGQFENSAYIKYPSLKPGYLQYMDEKYDYRHKYSNKKIYEISLTDLAPVLEELKANNWAKGKFGLGCIQWTGERTYTFFKLYKKESKGRDIRTIDEAISAQGKMSVSALAGSFKKA